MPTDAQRLRWREEKARQRAAQKKRGKLAHGRPPEGDRPMVKTSVTLPEELIKRLRALGNGSVSAGIRKLASL